MLGLAVTRLRITQIRSSVGEKQNKRGSLRSLRLRHVGDTVYCDDTPQVRGYISACSHLVRVEEIH